MPEFPKYSGILMPMSSIPSPYGIGTMGLKAYEFIDFLKKSKQKYWQILPLGPTGYGDSPYSSFSSYAGNPYLIDLDMLISEGIISKSDVSSISWGDDECRVDYGKLFCNRLNVLKIAYNNAKDKLDDSYDEFVKSNPWLDDYALFMAIKDKYNHESWTNWTDEHLRCHEKEALDSARKELKDEMNFYIFIQYLFFTQWEKLKSYAVDNGIKFFGDIPIYAAMDSADVWGESKVFQLNSSHKPEAVSGCPPDAFSSTGQLWGNPLYNWEYLRESNYDWWIRRIEAATKLYDLIRIDHFRGIDSYWSIPASETTAINGRWIKGPGTDFVNAISEKFGKDSFVAEDLGYLTDSVKMLVENSGFPGMKILEFAFDAHEDLIYLPHAFGYNSVCYIGTHDNYTVKGWLDFVDDEHKVFAKEYMKIGDEEPWNWGLIRTGMASKAKLFIMQMQDVLFLGDESRINTPGTCTGNWTWRMKEGALSDELSEKIAEYTIKYGRA